jgi:hypothetical protein
MLTTECQAAARASVDARAKVNARSRGGGWWAVGAGVALSMWSGGAAAAEVRTVTRTIGEGYMIRVPGPEQELLSRRRLVQYVNLGVYELLPPRRPRDLHRSYEDGQLHMVTSMRLRHDFGSFRREGQDYAAKLVESVDGRQIDVLFAYLEGQNLGGMIDLRAGRQFEMSGLDFFAFDGGWVRLRTPVHVAVEAFGGLQVDGSHLFGFPTMELDGTQGRPPDRAFSPMTGAAVALDDLKWVDARVAYRRTWTPNALNQGIVDEDGGQGLATTVDQELVSASAALRLADGKFGPYAALRYNLGTARVDDVVAGMHVALTERHLIRALYIRTIPWFDLDSIFNVFASEAFEDLRAVYEVRPSPRWTIALRSQNRIFREHPLEVNDQPTRGRRLGLGGGATLAYRRPRFSARIDGFGLAGEGGLRAGGSVDTRTFVAWQRLALDGRIYAVYFEDDAAAARRGYSVAVQAGLNLQLWRGIHLNLMGEEMITTYYTSALRVLASLSADWSLRLRR